MRRHVVITGTGRAGTTFLVQLLTHLGLDTGYTVDQLHRSISLISRGGLERNIFDAKCPYIVKNPRFCDIADAVLQTNTISIDRVFIPIRDLRDAAESRRNVTSRGEVKGGLWDTDSLEVGVQESILQNKIYGLAVSLSRTSIPVSFIHYPTLVDDPDYLFEKLHPILKCIGQENFRSVFDSVVDQHMPHSI